MIRARWSSAPGRFSLTVEGHEPGAQRGFAIICAYASSIVQTAVAGLMVLAQNQPHAVDVQEVPVSPNRQHMSDVAAELREA